MSVPPRRRFEEDSLRILRALRFSARFGFQIDPETFAAMQERASLMLVLSQERIFTELKGLITAPFAHRVLPLCPALLSDVCPGLQCAAAPYLARVSREDLALRFALLFSSPLIARKTLERLRAPKRILERVCLLLEETESPCADKIWMRKALARLGEEALKQRLDMERARERLSPGCDEALSLVLSRGDPYRTAMLALSGADLVLSGVCARGPLCGRVLEALLKEVMEEKIPNDRARLMARGRELAEKMDRM